MARLVPDVQQKSLMPHVQTRVLPKSTIYTDEMASYQHLGKMGYVHRRVRHGAKIYVDGPAHTSTIDGFWALLNTDCVESITAYQPNTYSRTWTSTCFATTTG